MSIRPHAFVAMPFGTKPGMDGQPIDFNRVYREYIAPAIEEAGLTAFRADEEVQAGDIQKDMFQELLIADLVLVDLSIHNPNVWYELGVRHALRSRGVVLVAAGKVPAAFDVYTDRKERYSLAQGGPDPATLEDDKRRLVAMIQATMESWHGRKISPVYRLMPNLQEPDWKSLRIGDVQEFWEEHEAWERRLDLARKSDHIGDVLVLAEEAPVAAFRADAWFTAGKALRKAGRHAFALEQLEAGLRVDPDNIDALREKGICLQRLGLAREAGHSSDRARQHYRTVLASRKDTETSALLGRVDKDAWTCEWRKVPPDQRREEASYQDALLRDAIATYLGAFRGDPAHYYSGINALTLMHLARHLQVEPGDDHVLATMAGAVRFAAENEAREDQLFWARASLGDLEALVGTAESVTRAYKEAIAKNDKDWFALLSCRDQLVMLSELGFRPPEIAAGIATFDRALARLKPPEAQWQPRLVLLFSGHTVDAANRAQPRFPADKEPIAAENIAKALADLGADERDMAYCQAASGGDLLFLEACQARGVRCQVLLPFAEPEFIERSIMPAANGVQWRDRFYAVKDKLTWPMRVMPIELGPAPPRVDPFERCNRWLLYSALAAGIDKVRFIALWDGGGGDGPGGTAHMYGEVKDRTGRVTWLDTRKLW